MFTGRTGSQKAKAVCVGFWSAFQCHLQAGNDFSLFFICLVHQNSLCFFSLSGCLMSPILFNNFILASLVILFNLSVGFSWFCLTFPNLVVLRCSGTVIHHLFIQVPSVNVILMDCPLQFVLSVFPHVDIPIHYLHIPNFAFLLHSFTVALQQIFCCWDIAMHSQKYSMTPRQWKLKSRGSALGITVILHMNASALAQSTYYAGRNLESQKFRKFEMLYPAAV